MGDGLAAARCKGSTLSSSRRCPTPSGLVPAALVPGLTERCCCCVGRRHGRRHARRCSRPRWDPRTVAAATASGAADAAATAATPLLLPSAAALGARALSLSPCSPFQQLSSSGLLRAWEREQEDDARADAVTGVAAAVAARMEGGLQAVRRAYLNAATQTTPGK